MNVSGRTAEVQEDPEAISKTVTDGTTKMEIEIVRTARQVPKEIKVVETRVTSETKEGRILLGRRRSLERY